MTIPNNKFKHLTILIVEDDEDSYFLITILFRNLKPILIHSRNGEEAVEMCKTNRDIDIVLMDLNLPLLNGFEATRKIRQFRPELPIIAQTAYTMGDEMNECFEAGCNDYITKPINKNELFHKLDKYVNK